jgi:alkylation response protein AidB-like acyl-CoA dehydrogenase
MMNLSYGCEAEDFRKEVRDFLQRSWVPIVSLKPANPEQIASFRQSATSAGYLYRGIPKRWGGSEQTPDIIRGQVIQEEFIRARAPMEVAGNGMNMLVPTLLEWGSEDQCETFIPATLSGRYIWGQGYSEPGAGSDLASVRTRAELVGDRWIINGQKIWTSQGGRATHMFLLVRTEPDTPKHEGISYLLIDLTQPGVTRRPIRQMTGDSGFYEFLFDNAESPASWIVGKRGQGWKVSRTTLKHERASIGSSAVLGNQFDKLVEQARTTKLGGRPAIENPLVRDELARIEGWVMAHRYSSYRIMSHSIADEDAGPIQLMMKVLLTEIGHEIALTAQEIIGDHSLIEPDSPAAKGRGPERWLDQIMGSLGNSIAGGTTNIQKNIIAERGLGLPRDKAGGVGG